MRSCYGGVAHYPLFLFLKAIQSSMYNSGTALSFIPPTIRRSSTTIYTDTITTGNLRVNSLATEFPSSEYSSILLNYPTQAMAEYFFDYMERGLADLQAVYRNRTSKQYHPLLNYLTEAIAECFFGFIGWLLAEFQAVYRTQVFSLRTLEATYNATLCTLPSQPPHIDNQVLHLTDTKEAIKHCTQSWTKFIFDYSERLESNNRAHSFALRYTTSSIDLEIRNQIL